VEAVGACEHQDDMVRDGFCPYIGQSQADWSAVADPATGGGGEPGPAASAGVAADAKTAKQENAHTRLARIRTN
jgi:hypothetical protein